MLFRDMSNSRLSGYHMLRLGRSGNFQIWPCRRPSPTRLGLHRLQKRLIPPLAGYGSFGRAYKRSYLYNSVLRDYGPSAKSVKQTFTSRILYESAQLQNDTTEALDEAGMLCPGTFAYLRFHVDILGSDRLLTPHVAALLDVMVAELLHNNDKAVL